jgi:hypothetical protein
MSALDTRDMLEGWETNAAALPAINDKVKWLGASENNPMVVIERVHLIKIYLSKFNTCYVWYTLQMI